MCCRQGLLVTSLLVKCRLTYCSQHDAGLCRLTLCVCVCDVHVLFRVNLHVCVTSTRCSCDQWWCWFIPQMGGLQASEKTASLYDSLCLTHADWLLAMQMDHLWSPMMTLFREQRLLESGKLVITCFVISCYEQQICYRMIMVLFSSSVLTLLSKKTFITILGGTLITWSWLWQLICQSLCVPLYPSNGEDVCILRFPQSLATIDFLCLWQAWDLVCREETFSRNRAAPVLHLPYLLLLNI